MRDLAERAVAAIVWVILKLREVIVMTTDDLDRFFTYHPPTPDQIPRYEELRAAARTFAEVILRVTPASADQTAAIRKVREAVMTANAAIACEP
ncbi:MAG TPA: hypothetical protein VKZ85_14305 [Woeseiaceae bacterium]|nr:hypothetical protein [Woeseiaceae bacterium]